MGAANIPNLPFMGHGAGLKTQFGIVLPPGGNVAAYVRSTGPQNYDEQQVKQRIVTTLAKGLSYCRAGLNDVVVVLPGHTENVTDATMLDNLVNGTRIIGAGNPLQDDAPTFRWTNTAGSWAIDNKNCYISGLKLQLEGANGITKAINITGSGVTLANNVIQTASGASNKATIAIEVGSGATECTIQGNYIYGSATHNSTDVIKVVGGTVPSQLTISDNVAMCSATAGNGIIHVTVAALNVLIARNYLYNTHTASTACIALDNVAADGLIIGNTFGTKNDGVATAQGVVYAGSNTLMVCSQNYSVDEKAKSGVLTPGAVAT